MKLPRAINSIRMNVNESKDMLMVFVIAISLVALVFNHAWISEDSFITFRYVSNTVDGLGPVFNVGERVQGFTHPLWFILLVLGSLIGVDPIFLSIVYGLVFTFITVAILGRALSQLVPNLFTLLLLVALACLLWGLSDPWISFQTSGLENSLSHLLIVAILIEAWLHTMSRPGWLLFLVVLLCLTRPDFIIFCIPVVIVLLIRMRSIRRVSDLAWAGIPALVWLVFAWTFYGNGLPNTAYAKMGIYPNWVVAVGQGLRYLQDWFTFDTIPAVSAVVLLGFAIFASRSKEKIVCVIGVLFYGIYIVWIGGDFMRGRMLTPILTTAVVLGSLTIAESSAQQRDKAKPYEIGIFITLFLALFFLQKIRPDPGALISEYGIVNERKFYQGYKLSSVVKHGYFESPHYDQYLADDLRRFSEACGHTTIHLRNPGMVAYLAGPNVSVIDTLGLTDAYIAKLPRKYLIDSTPRPGHPDKYIPVSYLLSKHDIALLPGWVESVSHGDCSLSSKLADYHYPSDLYPSP